MDVQSILGDEREARENCLVPEYVERFFQRAYQSLGLPLERKKDGLWRIERVPYEVLNVPHEFKQRFGPVHRKYLRFTFDKELARREGAEFVAPGHPSLEAVIEMLFVRAREDLRQGAVFTDPDDRLDGLLWLLEGEIRDGANDIAGKRLFALYQPALDGGSTQLQRMNSAVLWVLKPASEGASQRAVQALDQEAVVGMAV